MHQQSTHSAEAAHSKVLHGWIHFNRKAVLCAGDQLGKPATTPFYQLSQCPIKKSGQGSSPFERGHKTPCAVNINFTSEVCWLYTKAKTKTRIFHPTENKFEQIGLFRWYGWNYQCTFSAFPVFIFINHCSQPLRHWNISYLYNVKIR